MGRVSPTSETALQESPPAYREGKPKANRLVVGHQNPGYVSGAGAATGAANSGRGPRRSRNPRSVSELSGRTSASSRPTSAGSQQSEDMERQKSPLPGMVEHSDEEEYSPSPRRKQ